MKKVIKRVKEHVSVVFDCPFCSHSETVQCKMYCSLNMIILGTGKRKMVNWCVGYVTKGTKLLLQVLSELLLLLK